MLWLRMRYVVIRESVDRARGHPPRLLATKLFITYLARPIGASKRLVRSLDAHPPVIHLRRALTVFARRTLFTRM